MQTQKFYYTKYFCPETLQILVASDFAGVKLQTTEINKKYDSVSLVTHKGVLNRTNAILRYLAAGTNLNGSNEAEKNQINTWVQFFNVEIYPLLTELYGQVFGQKTPSETKYNYCLTEINKNLKVLDDSLKLRTFLVGNNITIVQITLVCYLQNLFKLIINESQRKKIINLIRWYNYVRDIPIFNKYFGNKNFCGKDSFKIDFNIKENQQLKPQNQESKQKQKQTSKKQNKSDKPPKIQKIQKTEVKQQLKTQKSNQKVQKSEQNAQASSESKFKLDDFKREFQNSQNQAQVLKTLLDNFDEQRFSIWKIYYLKDVTEGKILVFTNNMAKGSLQRIEPIRKTAFGSWGVFGQEGQYQIRGVMLWQGLQIHNQWKQHPSYQYHQFIKLSPHKQEDRQIIFDYLLQRQCAQGLMNRMSQRVV